MFPTPTSNVVPLFQALWKQLQDSCVLQPQMFSKQIEHLKN